jgi:hypothetical protein
MRRKLRYIICLLVLLFQASQSIALQIIINMSETQKNHLKSYGIAYWVLGKGGEVDWLLNYDGGSFMFNFDVTYENECKIRGVAYEVIAESKANSIHAEIANPEANMESVKLLKAPKIAVYTPKNKQPWDDAVTMVLEYAEIPYEKVFDDEVLEDKLLLYDWLHLHHEDFTGQYGKFWNSHRNAPWYIEEVKENEANAAKHGYAKVSQMKSAVTKKIRDFVLGGGFLFAMCSATDTYDIALAADGVDIVESMFDYDGMDPDAQEKLNFNNTFAFNKVVNCGSSVYINNGGQYKTRVRNLMIYNNVFVETTAKTSTAVFGQKAADTIPNVITIKNNIFRLTNGLQVARTSLTTPANQFVHTNNLFQLSGGSITNFPLDRSEINSTSTIWMNTTNANPLLWNYRLAPGSPAASTGTDVGLSRNFENNPVVFPYNMGIY